MLLKSCTIVLSMAKSIKNRCLKRRFTINCSNSWNKWELVSETSNSLEISTFWSINYGHRNITRKPKQKMPKRTLALIWLYFQKLGKPVERILAEDNLWQFGRDAFEHACSCLIFNNAARDPSALEMRKMISKHFSRKNELTEWLKDMYQKVISKSFRKNINYKIWNEYFSSSANFLRDVCSLQSKPIAAVKILES